MDAHRTRQHAEGSQEVRTIRLHRQHVIGVQTHRYKNNRLLVPARVVKQVEPIWSVSTTANSVTGETYEDTYHFDTIKDAVRYISIMASGDYTITADTWQTLAVQLPLKQLQEVEQRTGQTSSADPVPQQETLI